MKPDDRRPAATRTPKPTRTLGEQVPSESDATDANQHEDGDDHVDADKPSSDPGDVLAEGTSEGSGSLSEQAKGLGAAGEDTRSFFQKVVDAIFH